MNYTPEQLKLIESMREDVRGTGQPRRGKLYAAIMVGIYTLGAFDARA